MTEGMTPSEVALLDRDGGFGGAGGDYVTHADLDAQTTHAQLQEIAIQTANNNYETANNNISNYNQSQYLLGQLGCFVAWTPSGTQAATGAQTLQRGEALMGLYPFPER